MLYVVCKLAAPYKLDTLMLDTLEGWQEFCANALHTHPSQTQCGPNTQHISRRIVLP